MRLIDYVHHTTLGLRVTKKKTFRFQGPRMTGVLLGVKFDPIVT